MSGEGDFWSATIAAYQPLQLTSPEMTPKLLMRPPFRFIHDIVCGIDARFAAYSHVIPTELQDSTNVDSKEKKIEYLTMLVDYVNKLMHVQLDVNPKKIVSGSEPEKTNVFLQYLAAAVGYAQQDKVQKEAAAVAESTVLAAPSSSLSNAVNTASAAAEAELKLPNRESLPRNKSSSTDAVSRRQSHVAAIDSAEKFNRKLDGYSLNLNPKEQRDIKMEGQSMVRMWNELAAPQVETKPSHLPQEALETAIERQWKTIQTVEALLRENDTVITDLEALVS